MAGDGPLGGLTGLSAVVAWTEPWGLPLQNGETRFLRLETPHGNWGKRGGSRGEAWGKLGEAGYFWGKHVFCTLKFFEKTGEANPPSTPFIILNFDTQQG